MKSEVRSPKSEVGEAETQKLRKGMGKLGNQEIRKAGKEADQAAPAGRFFPEFLSSIFPNSLSEFLSLALALFGFRLSAAAFLLVLSSTQTPAAAAATFGNGGLSYTNGDFATAAQTFAELAAAAPSPGTFCSLGNAEWRLARTGPAILAWERAVWLAPYHAAARNNLRFARITTQLTAPELAW